MKSSEYYASVQELYDNDKISAEVYDAMMLNAEAFITEDDDEEAGIEHFEDALAPSWYIYTDAEGIAHSETYGQITEDQFFTKVSRRICFDDIDDTSVQKIYYKGKEVYYAGWQPCMRFEYKDRNKNTVWVGEFPEWDH